MSFIKTNLTDSSIIHKPTSSESMIACSSLMCIYVKLFEETIDGKPMVCLQVIDQGIGIPGDKTATIFERFEQVDNLLIRQAEGTGIGLSLVKMLVEMLGGAITLTSRIGSGSNFSVLLPDKTAREESMYSSNIFNNDRLIRSIEVEFSDIYLYN